VQDYDFMCRHRILCKAGAAYLRNLRAAFYAVRPRASITSVLIRSPGRGGFFIGIFGLLLRLEQDSCLWGSGASEVGGKISILIIRATTLLSQNVF
jgi:hypothetical protein